MDSRNRHDIPIKAARAFIAIIKHKSFSGAAKELHLSQPAVSGHIKRLRQIMGGELFEKSAAGFVPTELGWRLERHVQRIVAFNDHAIAIAGRNAYSETIYVGIQSAFARVVTADVVKLCNDYEKASFGYFGGSAPDLAANFRSGYIDLAVLVAPPTPMLRVLAEWNEQLVWVRAIEKFPITEGKPIPFVGRNDGFIDRKVLDRLDEREVPYTMVCNARELHAMVAWVESGLGLMAMPQRCVMPPLMVAHDRRLPDLPEMRVGVFCKEVFDIERHAAFLDEFVAAVRPPSSKVIHLASRKSGSANSSA